MTFCAAPSLFWPRQAHSLPVCSYVADYVLRWGQLHVGRERGFGREIRLEETIAEGGRLLGHVLNFLEVMPIGHRAANKVGEPEVQLGKFCGVFPVQPGQVDRLEGWLAIGSRFADVVDRPLVTELAQQANCDRMSFE